MDFSKPFNKSWSVYKNKFIDLSLGFLIMLVVSILSLGILFPGLFPGYQLILLKALRGEKFKPTDVFAGLSFYWNITGLFLYSSLIIGLLMLTLVGIIPAILIGTWWMYAGLFVIDRKQSIAQAMLSSKKVVRKNNVWLHFIFITILVIIGNAGHSLACIGGLITLITIPFSMLVFCAAYEQERF
jgi:hypothetical protein